MNEADVKRAMVKSVKEKGGYARRFEDSYGVGIYDLIMIPFGLPVFMAEVKMIKHSTFGPTLRQHVELERINYVAFETGHAIPIMIGYYDGIFYFSKPNLVIIPKDCFSVTTSKMPFHDQLVQYYHSRRK
jgi:hypothetical protein